MAYNICNPMIVNDWQIKVGLNLKHTSMYIPEVYYYDFAMTCQLMITFEADSD